MATITPEIIDGVAQDLRLAVVTLDQRGNGGAHLPKSNEREQTDLLLAVKKLLEVHGRMQETETKGRLQ
jgi:hypothetical protein